MRVTVEDGESRLVLESPEAVGKSWAAYNAAHPHHGGHPKKPAVAKPTPSEFQRAQQTIADEKAGKPVSAADLKNAHAVHEAHLAHLAHEKALAEQAAEAKGAPAQPAPAAASQGAGPAKIAEITATQKSAAPQRYVLGIAYQAGPDQRIQRGADGGRDYFEPDELERAAFTFMKSGPRVGLFHMDGTDNGATATVVESYIWRGPDWDLGDGIVVRKGDWLVGAILSPLAWQMHLDGKLTGWSPQGTARRLRPTRAAAS